MNNQKPEKAVTSPFLSVHSIFKTIQGEGPFTGTPCVFIRLAGCNLQCPGCDTDYTSQRREQLPSCIVKDVQQLAGTAKLVVITGGEPFRQDLTDLFHRLLLEGFYVQVETNGTLPPSKNVPYCTGPDARSGVYIVCSPKTGTITPSILYRACAIKYVARAGEIDMDGDGLPLRALDHTAHPVLARPPRKMPSHRVYLQPMDEGDPVVNKRNLDACVASCLKHGYTLQLQIHKIIEVE